MQLIDGWAEAVLKLEEHSNLRQAVSKATKIYETLEFTYGQNLILHLARLMPIFVKRSGF